MKKGQRPCKHIRSVRVGPKKRFKKRKIINKGIHKSQRQLESIIYSPSVPTSSQKEAENQRQLNLELMRSGIPAPYLAGLSLVREDQQGRIIIPEYKSQNYRNYGSNPSIKSVIAALTKKEHDMGDNGKLSKIDSSDQITALLKAAKEGEAKEDKAKGLRADLESGKKPEFVFKIKPKATFDELDFLTAQEEMKEKTKPRLLQQQKTSFVLRKRDPTIIGFQRPIREEKKEDRVLLPVIKRKGEFVITRGVPFDQRRLLTKLRNKQI